MVPCVGLLPPSGSTLFLFPSGGDGGTGMAATGGGLLFFSPLGACFKMSGERGWGGFSFFFSIPK